VGCSYSSAWLLTGFSFVYMDDERDAEDAIRHLDNMEFGRQRRRLSVEWAKVVWQSTILECSKKVCSLCYKLDSSS
jgi:hypothetical protein